MLKRIKTALDPRGDTIVEVMVVLAVLGLSIGISYATAGRSLLNSRQAQENSYATELAQGQVEGLQSLGCVSGDPACDPTDSANTSYQLFHQPGPFCLDDSYNIVPWTDPTTPAPACLIDNLYQIGITYTNSATQPSTFEVLVQWPDVQEGTDTVRQDYTIPDSSTPAGGGGGGGGASNVVTITSPGNQTNLITDTISLQINATDSAVGQTLTYSATGLPAGLSINPATGLITGTPTTTGTKHVRVTATDTTGATDFATFNWLIKPLFTLSVYASHKSCSGSSASADYSISGGPNENVQIYLAFVDGPYNQWYYYGTRNLTLDAAGHASGHISGSHSYNWVTLVVVDRANGSISSTTSIC